MSETFLTNLLFTKSTGKVVDDHDVSFNDAIDYGKFPANMKITGIKQIEIYSDISVVDDESDAYITGLVIKYDGVDTLVTHGLVDPQYLLKSLPIDITKHILVGAYGRLKETENPIANNRVATLGFVELDTTTGKAAVKGPYGSPDNLGSSWASFGPLVAFQGTDKPLVGITTLGFVKKQGEAPGGLEVLGRNDKADLL